MNFLQIAVFVAFTACIISFSWALMGGFFRSVEKPPLGLRLIQIVGLVFTLAHGYALVQARDMHPFPGFIGLAMYMLSFWLFWSCIRANRQKPLTLAFNSDPPEHLTAHGPYRFIRHPFYSSYLVSWVAGVVATRQLWLLVSVAVMTTIYVFAARVEERKFLSSSLEEEYANYRSRTGMFWPRLGEPKTIFTVIEKGGKGRTL